MKLIEDRYNNRRSCPHALIPDIVTRCGIRAANIHHHGLCIRRHIMISLSDVWLRRRRGRRCDHEIQSGPLARRRTPDQAAEIKSCRRAGGVIIRRPGLGRSNHLQRPTQLTALITKTTYRHAAQRLNGAPASAPIWGRVGASWGVRKALLRKGNYADELPVCGRPDASPNLRPRSHASAYRHRVYMRRSGVNIDVMVAGRSKTLLASPTWFNVKRPLAPSRPLNLV